MRTPVTAIILTFDEERNIGRCIEHLSGFDEIVVLDSGSRDRTVETARSVRRDVRILENPFEDFGQQRNWALDNAMPRNEWILFIDADEFMTPRLAREIAAFVANPRGRAGAFIAGRNYFLGSWLRHCTYYPSFQLRLLKLGEVRFCKMGHGQQEVTDRPLAYLKGWWIHEGFSKGVEQWIARHNRYSTEEVDFLRDLAREPVAWWSIATGTPIERRRQLKILGAKLPGRPVLRFVYAYVVKLGFMDGYAGFLYCLLLLAHQIHLSVKKAERGVGERKASPNLRRAIGDMARRIPPGPGALLSAVPYSWRLGPAYTRTQTLAVREANLPDGEIRDRILARTRGIVAIAGRIPFWREFWKTRGFEPSMLRKFEDIARIPVATKDDLRATPLDRRSVLRPGRMLINTGGTSGQPLEFYADSEAFAREWAFMHLVWRRLGYRTTDAKLTFRGKNLGRDAIRYNAVHHEYMVNTYAPPERQLAAVARVARRIRFVHGYPSAIAEFCQIAGATRPDVVSMLREGLKGVLFGSEYPAPIYRKPVEEILGAPTISWYGHSEMAILAYEEAPYEYVPFQAYGLCEAVAADGGEWRLVGTSYFNDVSPFVRYDTGDLIVPSVENGLVKSFRVASGRVGDFVVDANGTRVSLTSLVFGRHHRAFGRLQSVQVRQRRPGAATLVVVPLAGERPPQSELAAGFDLTNLALAIDFEIRDSPWRTTAGKAPLLIPADAK